MTISQLFSHLTIGDAIFLFTLVTAIGTGLHLIALQLAKHGYKKAASGFDAVATIFVNALSVARKVAAMFGVKLEVLTVAQTIAVAEQKAGLARAAALPPQGNSGFATIRAMGAVSAYVLLVCLAVTPVMVHGCAGSTTTIGATTGGSVTPGGSFNWTAGISIGITVARPIIMAAKVSLDAVPSFSEASRTQMDTGFQIALDSLPLAQTALDTFSHAPTTANLCQVRFYIEQALTGALQSLVIARDTGANSPALAGVQGALGGLAAAVDMFGGSCASPNTLMARSTSAQEQLQAVLASH